MLRPTGNGTTAGTVGPALLAEAAALAGRPAWSGGGVTLDHAALADRIRTLAAALRGLGIRRGRKVGLHLAASGDRIALSMALWSLGAVIVPLDPALGQAKLTMAIQGAGPDLLIHDPGERPSSIRLAGVRTVDRADLIAPGADPRPAAAPRPDHPAVILYGEGEQDTGRGVILTHAALVAAARGLALRYGLRPGHRVAVPLALNHAVRLTAELACVMAGAEIADDPLPAPGISHLILADGRATRRVLDGLETPPPAHLAPGMIVATGDGPAIRSLSRLFPAARVYNAYARAELAGIALASDPRDPAHTAHTTVGRPLKGVEVMIVDPRTGMDMLLYEIGEIWIRGVPVMQRYFHAPQATRRVLDASGFFRTGDMGYLDSEGRVIVCRDAHAQI